MRKIKLCLIISGLFLIGLQQDNFYFTDTLIHTPIRTFLFIDPSTGWIVGQNGLFKTNDGGLHWISLNKYLPRVSSGEVYPYALNDGFFIDSQIGWVLSANRKILKTTNSGLSWIYQTSSILSVIHAEPAQARFLKIKFIDKNHGWVLGTKLVAADLEVRPVPPSETQFILKTTDGGSSWSKKDLIKVVGTFPNMTFEHGTYRNFQFLDARNGWLMDSNTIIKTQDGGDTWALQSKMYYPLEDFIFVDKSNAWAVGWFGKIFCTHDGGNQWLVKDMGKDYLFNNVGFVDQEHGWIAGGLKKAVGPYEGILLGTNNGGETWNIQYQAVGKFLFPFFIDSQHGWLAIVKASPVHEMDEIRIMYTSDGGRTWIPLFNGEDPLPR